MFYNSYKYRECQTKCTKIGKKWENRNAVKGEDKIIELVGIELADRLNDATVISGWMCIWKQEGEKKTNQRRMASRHNQARHETVSLTGSVVMIMEAPILPQISTLKFRVRRKMPNHGTVFTLSQMKRIIDASQHPFGIAQKNTTPTASTHFSSYFCYKGRNINRRQNLSKSQSIWKNSEERKCYVIIFYATVTLANSHLLSTNADT